MKRSAGRQWLRRVPLPMALIALVWLWGPIVPQLAWGGDLVWQVGEATVVSQGTAMTGPTGVFIQGVELTAKATAHGASMPFRNGLLTLSFDLFSPAQDMPGQTAGRWYLVGSWRLENTEAPQSVRQVRHNPAVLAGQLSADLDFNPLDAPGAFSALLRPSPVEAVKAGLDEGLLHLDESFAGELSLQAKPGREKEGTE